MTAEPVPIMFTVEAGIADSVVIPMRSPPNTQMLSVPLSMIERKPARDRALQIEAAAGSDVEAKVDQLSNVCAAGAELPPPLIATSKEMMYQCTWATPAIGGPHNSTETPSSTVSDTLTKKIVVLNDTPIETEMSTSKWNGLQ